MICCTCSSDLASFESRTCLEPRIHVWGTSAMAHTRYLSINDVADMILRHIGLCHVE